MNTTTIGIALLAAAFAAPAVHAQDIAAGQAAAASAAAAAESAAAGASLAAGAPAAMGAALAASERAMERASAVLDAVPWDLEQAQGALQREQARAESRAARERGKDAEDRYYEAGQQALDNSRWDRAVSSFDRVLQMKGSHADAALYWKAYAQYKEGLRADALSSIAVLVKEYPNSRYLQQAKALDVEVRRDTGQPVRPETENDEDLKLLAIQALQNSDPEQAIPMLQKILQGTSSPKLKERALFVLATSNSPKARDVLVNIAKGSNATPDVQMKAIQYLGIHGNAESRAALADIYGSTTDVDMKRRILRAFMIAGEKDRLLRVAQTEQNPDLRTEAVRQLGVMGATDELWTMYQKDASLEVKKQILQAMFTSGNAARLIDLAKSEQNPELRRLAVRNLGLMGSKQTGDALVQIYEADKSPDVRNAVVQGLFIQNNAESLVALARKEQDPAMKKSIVEKLSLMRSKVATDYLLELLNK